MHIALAVVSSAWAALPVYILNSDAVAPAKFTLDFTHFGSVASHFLGLANTEGSQEAIEAAQFVPGPFLDDRESNIVMITDFDADDALDQLGSALFQLNPAADSDSVGAESVPLRQSDAVLAVEGLESKDGETLLVSAKGIQPKLLDALLALKSKVMVLGVPSGKTAPALGVVESKKSRKTKKEKSSPRGAVGPFDSEEECIKSTNSCSGHGACIKSNGKYSCACKATVKDGYTTHWGGYSCEKRDISWQFNLLLWTGVGILFATIAGVGLLFSIDSQPLPGVLNVL